MDELAGGLQPGSSSCNRTPSRITGGEIRIYSLTNLRARRPPLVSGLTEDIDCSRLEFEIRKISFSFLKNSDELMITRRRG